MHSGMEVLSCDVLLLHYFLQQYIYLVGSIQALILVQTNPLYHEYILFLQASPYQLDIYSLNVNKRTRNIGEHPNSPLDFELKMMPLKTNVNFPS